MSKKVVRSKVDKCRPQFDHWVFLQGTIGTVHYQSSNPIFFTGPFCCSGPRQWPTALALFEEAQAAQKARTSYHGSFIPCQISSVQSRLTLFLNAYHYCSLESLEEFSAISFTWFRLLPVRSTVRCGRVLGLKNQKHPETETWSY